MEFVVKNGGPCLTGPNEDDIAIDQNQTTPTIGGRDADAFRIVADVHLYCLDFYFR